jgi:SAM-dependent methyltransferase
MGDFIQCKAAGESILTPSLQLVKEILEYPFDSIIDFGCGFGHHVQVFSEAGRNAVGVDVQFVDEAKESANQYGYTLVEGSWSQLSPKSFDAGFSHHCLEHARDPIAWLNEWAKIIKPGGKFFVSVPSFRTEVLAGHICNGWTCGQLAYVLSVAGFDCKNGLFEEIDGSIWGFVDRGENIGIVDTHIFGFGGTVEARMPSTMYICDRGVRYLGSPKTIFTHL